MEASVSEQDLSQNIELSEDEQAQLKALDESLVKFEGLKRWSDVIKTLISKAELVKDPAEKVTNYARAGELYIEKSSNQAEAIKCYARVLEIDRSNVEAITRLKDMYEKRRDWEKLVEVMRAEIELLDEADRPLRYAEIARPRDAAPAQARDLHRAVAQGPRVRSRQRQGGRSARWSLREALASGARSADVLELQASQITNDNDLVNLLLKLGGLYGDKLNDDRGAVRAFKRLLELRPDERRAQEQLKKRYAALRDWDALEDFYSTTDKWDELIRVFEREGDDANVAIEERISLIKRVARLWAEKKEKADRAARSYEKILELDAEQPGCGRRAEPHLRAGQGRQEARGRVRGSPQARRGRGRASHAAA